MVSNVLSDYIINSFYCFSELLENESKELEKSALTFMTFRGRNLGESF